MTTVEGAIITTYGIDTTQVEEKDSLWCFDSDGNRQPAECSSVVTEIRLGELVADVNPELARCRGCFFSPHCSQTLNPKDLD